jgi:uncharacterized protein YaiI (UPF0178 family)
LKILIDADACPKQIKEILYRAANKRKIECILVANQNMYHPASNYIRSIRVNKGFDVADDHIVTLVDEGDLIITSDIPLADEAVQKGGIVITSKGQMYTKSNIGRALAMRNFFTELRETGMVQTKTKPFGNQQSQAFASELDRYLTKQGF